MKRDTYNVTEFYRSGEIKPFCRRSNIIARPALGDTLDVAGVSGKVVAVTWNMDYCDEEHEQWRCNIYVKAPQNET
jgi:hypothetical protein